MSDSWGRPWSDNPNAPRISRFVRLEEKTTLAGALFAAVLYGIVVAVFFQCMSALLNSTNRATWGVKWPLVAHTLAMFLLATIYAGVSLNIQSISFIDNREFPGSDLFPPGPAGYQYFLLDQAIAIIPYVFAVANNWLAEGLLLYRCYVVYSSNYWAIVVPGLMYIASVATGIVFLYQISRPFDSLNHYSTVFDFGISYYSIAVALNVLLTLMLAVRLFLRGRKVRRTLGTQSASSGLYNAIMVMLVESCALYTVTFLLYVGLVTAQNTAENVFFSTLIQVQVIAPFLITLRVAKRRASTGDDTVSGNTSSIRYGNHGRSAGGNGTLCEEYPMSLRDTPNKTPTGLNVLNVAVETTIDLHHDD